MKQDFFDRLKDYFNEDSELFIKKLDDKYSQGFFLNTNKCDRDKILDLIDFDYYRSKYTDDSFNHDFDSIGKSKAYELGIIYPQEIAASLSTKYIDKKDTKLVVDMCAAPGGKTINILNRLDKDILCITNEINHTRSLILSSNLERLGLDNVIITNKKTKDLVNQLENCVDIVILDAPCSGEGIIRKYREILDNYDIENIKELSILQKELLEDAYYFLNKDGLLIYSTCTYSFEEDEDQIINFLNNHSDMELINIEDIGHSKLKGTIKMSILEDTEGQFIAILKKNSDVVSNKLNYLKPVKEKLIDDFITDNLNLDNYYLYKYNNRYYLSLIPLIDLKQNVLRYGIYVGEIIKNRFEPSHCLYRSNSLREYFGYIYDLNDEEYDLYISGRELKANLDHDYYLITYKGLSLGFGKYSNGTIKNKYPKGLRRMI